MTVLPDQRGPALGRAACHFERGYREFVRGLLVLDRARLQPSEALAELVEDIGDAAASAVALADAIGHAESIKRADDAFLAEMRRGAGS